MSQTISDEILNQLRGGSLQQISQEVGASEQETESAISTALPLLLGALGNNAQQPGGAQALFGALLRDHGGASSQPQQAVGGGLDVGNILGSLLGGSAGGAGGLLGSILGGQANNRQLNGEGILGHIFGNNLGRAESSLNQASNGLSSAGVHKLLVILAPIVLSYLGKQVAQGKASNPDVLGSLLGQERQQIQQQGGLAGNLLTSVLDQDGDGKLDMGDLFKLGAGFLNKR